MSNKGKKLPRNWQPTDSDRNYGRELHLNDQQIDGLAEDMRLWAGANEHRAVAHKSNWSMAFKGWMRREVQKGKWNGKRNGSVIEAWDRLQGRFESGVGGEVREVGVRRLLS